MASNHKSDQIQTIMDKLSISDALALQQAFPYSAVLKSCYEKRANPVHYLSRTFKYPLTLMSVMFDTGAIFSGSRGLDYFVPGSARKSSDWDFYVPGYKESVADMVQALSLCGVTWEPEGDKIVETLREKGEAHVSRGVLEALWSWIDTLDQQSADALLGEALHEVVLAFRSVRHKMSTSQAFKITYSSHRLKLEAAKLEAAPSWPFYKDSVGNSFSVLQGSIQTQNGKQGVQLMIGMCYSHVRSAMSFLKEFYGSHVQCFVGGWCASHMYYPEASEKQSIFWKQSSGKVPKRVASAVENYEQRGFEFSEAVDDGPKTRRLRDGGAVFLDYGNIYRQHVRESHLELLDLWLSERRTSIESISWIEFDQRIFCLQNSVQACYRTEQKSFSSSGLELPLNRLRRLGNIIAVNTWGPDTLKSAAFRSTIATSLTNARWQVPELARSGTVFCCLKDATPWSWAL